MKEPSIAGIEIADRVVRLRRSHPQAPAIDAFDVVFDGVAGEGLVFGEGLTSPWTPFGQAIAAAFDDVMTAQDWMNLTGIEAASDLRTQLLPVWDLYVLSRFRERYGVRQP